MTAELAAFGIVDRADALPSEAVLGSAPTAGTGGGVRPAGAAAACSTSPSDAWTPACATALADRLARARDAGLAVLFASHDAAFVQTVADDALVLGDDECRVLPPASATATGELLRCTAVLHRDARSTGREVAPAHPAQRRLRARAPPWRPG